MDEIIGGWVLFVNAEENKFKLTTETLGNNITLKDENSVPRTPSPPPQAMEGARSNYWQVICKGETENLERKSRENGKGGL